MSFESISAVILAAGESRRMGQSKMLLPWGSTTVLGQVLETFTAAGVADIVVVTGGARLQVEGLVERMGNGISVRTVFNPDFAQGGMLQSIQVGLRALPSGTAAALIGLGDQPQVRESVIRRLCRTFVKTGAFLIIPSFQNRRGHPWLAARPVWPGILTLPLDTTPRQFLHARAQEITYLAIGDDSILQDIDTPEEYRRQKP